MSRIFNNIIETIGNTPIVRINKLVHGKDVELLAKLEAFNPLSSVKDRVASAMIEAAERDGKINKDTVLLSRLAGIQVLVWPLYVR